MKKLTQEEFEKKVFEKGEGAFEILSQYVNQRTNVKVRHNCGYEWETKGDTLMNKPGCPKCGGNSKKTTEQYKNEVHSLVGDEYTVLNEYKSNKDKIEFIHNNCETVFFMEAKSFLSGQRCPECKKVNLSKRFRKTHEMFVQQVYERVKDEYEVLTEYQRKDINLKMKHNICNTVFEVAPNHFLSSMNSRCPRCKSSKGEKVIEDFLIKNNVEFKKQFRIKECRNIRPLPFDFAIFKNGKLSVLIEYDGIQHYEAKWGTSEFNRTKRNDQIKNTYCQQNKIPLIRIPYFVTEIENELVKLL